ncbi:MAG TPA: hypothetical protein VMW13_10050 [Dehalococcoidales bacterium]|nr:hypothetical protein [Dehalococcoidales bacterium]
MPLDPSRTGKTLDVAKTVILTGDAAVGDVLDPKTFYKDDPETKLTGTLATVAIVAANDSYPAGYHVGNVGGLDAIDADLASANIKSGKTIFGKAGAATVQDIADADLAVAEAPTGKKFYAVTGGVKTGTGTKVLSAANETVAAGYYAATTLSTVDVHLAAENIKTGVVIFGFTGALIPVWYASDTLRNSNDTEQQYNSIAYSKEKETKLDQEFSGGIRIKFDGRRVGDYLAYAKIYRNGVAIGTEQTMGGAGTAYVTFSEDFAGVAWAINDLIQLYVYSADVSSAYAVKNFRFYYDVVADAIPTTNQDP